MVESTLFMIFRWLMKFLDWKCCLLLKFYHHSLTSIKIQTKKQCILSVFEYNVAKTRMK